MPWDPVVLEAWSLSQSSNSRIRIPLPDAWLAKQVAQQQAQTRQTASIWKDFALLHPTYRSQIHQLINEKEAVDARYQWTLVSLEIIHRKRRSGLLTRIEEHISVQIILERSSIGSFIEPSSSDVSRLSVTSLSQPSVKDSPVVLLKEAPGAPNENAIAADQQRSTIASGPDNSHDRLTGGPGKDTDGRSHLRSTPLRQLKLILPNIVPLPLSLHLDGTSYNTRGSRSREHSNLSQQTSSERRRQVQFDLPEKKRSSFSHREPSYGTGRRDDWIGPYVSGYPVVPEGRSYPVQSHPGQSLYFPAELDGLYGYHRPYPFYPPSRGFPMRQPAPLSRPRRMSPPRPRRKTSRDRWRETPDSQTFTDFNSEPRRSRQRSYIVIDDEDDEDDEDDTPWARSSSASTEITSEDSDNPIRKIGTSNSFKEELAHVRFPRGSGQSREECSRKQSSDLNNVKILLARKLEREALRTNSAKSAGAPHTESKEEVLSKYLKMYTSIKNENPTTNVTTDPRPASPSTNAVESTPTDETRMREEPRSSEPDLHPIMASSAADDAVSLAGSNEKGNDDEESVWAIVPFTNKSKKEHKE